MKSSLGDQGFLKEPENIAILEISKSEIRQKILTSIRSNLWKNILQILFYDSSIENYEIGQRLNKTEGAIKMARTRIMKALREKFTEAEIKEMLETLQED